MEWSGGRSGRDLPCADDPRFDAETSASSLAARGTLSTVPARGRPLPDRCVAPVSTHSCLPRPAAMEQSKAWIFRLPRVSSCSTLHSKSRTPVGVNRDIDVLSFGSACMVRLKAAPRNCICACLAGQSRGHLMEGCLLHREIALIQRTSRFRLQSAGKFTLSTQSGNQTSYKAVIEANESGRPAVEKLEPFHPELLVIGCSRGSSQRRSLYTPCACVTGDSAVLISAADRGPVER
jgi:hypothetical protein